MTYNPLTSTSRTFQLGFYVSQDITNVPPVLPNLQDKVNKVQRLMLWQPLDTQGLMILLTS